MLPEHQQGIQFGKKKQVPTLEKAMSVSATCPQLQSIFTISATSTEHLHSYSLNIYLLIDPLYTITVNGGKKADFITTIKINVTLLKRNSSSGH